MRKTFNIEITYDDDVTESYQACPDFAARSIVEDRIGSPILVMQRIGKMDLRLSDLVCVIYACILSGDNKKVDEGEIGNALNDAGIDKAAEIAMPLLLEWMPIEKKTKRTSTVSRKKRTKSR